MDVFNCEQYSDEWWQCRLGIPTASEFATVLAKGRDGGDSITRKRYLYRLVGEIITGQAAETYTNGHMERGHEMEPLARERYKFMSEHETTPVGFIRNGRAGCSPDSFIGNDGLLEIKTKLPHLMVEVHLRGGMPPEHKAQCQGQLWLAEREWVDFVAYWPGMPLFVHREMRDEIYMDRLMSAIGSFNEELDCIVEQMRRYGDTA